MLHAEYPGSGHGGRVSGFAVACRGLCVVMRLKHPQVKIFLVGPQSVFKGSGISRRDYSPRRSCSVNQWQVSCELSPWGCPECSSSGKTIQICSHCHPEGKRQSKQFLQTSDASYWQKMCGVWKRCFHGNRNRYDLCPRTVGRIPLQSSLKGKNVHVF